jgi:hypothetical protein
LGSVGGLLLLLLFPPSDNRFDWCRKLST